MIQFLQVNFIDIIVWLLFVIGMLLLYKNNKKETVRKILLSLPGC